MKKILFLTAFLALLLYVTGIHVPEKKKTVREDRDMNSETVNALPSELQYMPLNYSYQRAMWFTYMDYAQILDGKSEEEFRSEVFRRFRTAAQFGVNTVYVQVRAFCDAYYRSELFPNGRYYTDADFDPLEIMISEAHSLGMSFHAWINPLRSVSSDEIKNISSDYRFSDWYSEMKKGKNIVAEINGRIWLDPAYDEVHKYICDGIAEIIENYQTDGIHIDDYFYPDTSSDFDRNEFLNSGYSNIDQWRRDNISRLVSEMYRTVKTSNSRVLFGISPQGNQETDLSSQYADVIKWMSEPGYCDYIVPQLYYGFENETCPFSETLEKWSSACTSGGVKLVAGLCTYKIGSEDRWAGRGADEWINDPDIILKQTSECLDDTAVGGIAFYSYSSTFEDKVSSDIMTMGKVQEIRELWKKKN